ncbi:MAG: hypothetical protein WA294_02735, partial [Acidobacteriaceae bacterium]
MTRSHISRRALLGGLGAGAAQLLFTRRIAASVLAPLTGEPEQLDLTLTALSARTLRIAVAPV